MFLDPQLQEPNLVSVSVVVGCIGCISQPYTKRANIEKVKPIVIAIIQLNNTGTVQ